MSDVTDVLPIAGDCEMSNVTDVILTSSIDLGHGITLEDVNRHFEGGEALYKVDKPADAPGKAIQADIYIGAFNYMDLDSFVAHLRSLPWEEYERGQVRLFVQFEHDEYGFHEVRIWPEAAR